MSRRLLAASSGAATGVIPDPVDPPDPGEPIYRAFLFAGQSNMSGYGGSPDPTLDAPNARIFCWPASGPSANTAIIPAVELIPYPTVVGLSPTMSFAKALLPSLPANEKILLIPRAVPGTGLVAETDPWNPAGGEFNTLYTDAITQANNAQAAADLPVVFSGILWLQGEWDSQTGRTGSEYQAKLDALIAGFRAGIDGADDAPFIVLGMAPEFTAGTEAEIRAVHAATPGRVANTAYVPGPSGKSDGLHYTGAGARTIGAAAYTNGYATLV